MSAKYARSSPNLLTQTITNLYKIVPEDFIRTCTKSSQDLGQHFHIPLGPLKVQHINLARLWCKRDNCFMRVCAVEMHIDISKNRFTREFTGKGRAPSFLCDPAQSTWSCAIDMHMESHGHVRRAVFTRQFSRKMPRTGTTVLAWACAILCGRNAHVTKTVLMRHFGRKCRDPKRRQPFCAFLRSANAHGLRTKQF